MQKVKKVKEVIDVKEVMEVKEVVMEAPPLHLIQFLNLIPAFLHFLP
jgi:hypothetical protein